MKIYRKKTFYRTSKKTKASKKLLNEYNTLINREDKIQKKCSQMVNS